MKKIAFICPYFGRLPEHCQLWLNSCAHNSDITWFLITDDKREFSYPPNVIVRYTTLEELKKEFQKKFDFPISLEGVYKLGDYKPLYGYIYEELLEGFDAWGHIDVADEIYGDIRAFITDDLLEKYDKLLLFGHMSIYKNTPEVNRRFMEQSDVFRSYKLIFSSKKFYNFEEIANGSITRVYVKNGWEIGRLDEYVADVSSLSYPFRLGKWSDDFNKLTYFPHIPLIFSWEDGKTYGYFIVNNKIKKKEYLYVHFKRRKMKVLVSNNCTKYLIVPDGFVSQPDNITANVIRKYSRNKLFYTVYFREKEKALKVRFKKLKEKLGEGEGIKGIGKGMIRKFPDNLYLKIKYRYIFKKPLNLKNPVTFNEKLQWLKLYNRKDLYISLVDKYEVKRYVEEKIGKEHIAKTIGIFNDFKEINFNKLPQSFVIKTTHDSGGVVICKNKDFFDIEEARKKIEKSLKTDFYSLGREWPYKNVNRRILIEEYLEDESYNELKDYKVFCFDGEPKYIQLDYNRFIKHQRNMYDINWNLLPIRYTYDSDKSRVFDKPERLSEMLELARKLTNGIPFVRCDFYILKDRVVFGELTFFPGSGFEKFEPNSYDDEFGKFIYIN